MLYYITLILYYTRLMLCHITMQAVECGDDFTPQGISNVLWAFATLKVVPEEKLLRIMLQQSVEQCHKFDAQTTANLLWALAALGEQQLPGELMHVLLEAMIRLNPKPQTLNPKP
jgi:hypothetical protein